MNKFRKKLSKVGKELENAVVVGTGFGYLEEIVDIFKTVFVISEEKPKERGRNLVYRETFGDLTQLANISIIFVDRNQLSHLGSIVPVWNRYKSLVIIEGREVIGRDKSLLLYQNGFEAIDQQKSYHVWKMKQ